MRKICFLSFLFFTTVKSFCQQGNTFVVKTPFQGTSRSGAISFAIDDKIYFGLGEASGTYYNDFWEYDSKLDKWTKKADFPGGARSAASAVAIGNKGFVGLGGTFNGNNDWWLFDPTNNSWSKKADFPGLSRFASFTFAVGNMGYVGSGRKNDGLTTVEFWQYNSGTDTWIQKSDFGGSGRFFGVGFNVGAIGYVGTGYSYANINDLFLNDFWSYDPSIDSWTKRKDFGGTSRSYASGFSLKGFGYIGFGTSKKNNNNEFQSDIWKYDPLSDSWVKAADLPLGTSGCAAAATQTRGYVGLGINGNPDIPSVTYTKQLFEFVPQATLNVREVPQILSAGGSFVAKYEAALLTFAIDNVLSVELSSSTGNFTDPKVIGSTTTTNLTGSISCIVPPDLVQGSYKIRITSSNENYIGNAYEKDLQINPVVTDVLNIESKALILVPNPVIDKLTILNTDLIDEPVVINLTNSLGQVLKEFRLSGQYSIDLSFLTSGIYFVYVNKGKATNVYRIIKM